MSWLLVVAVSGVLLFLLASCLWLLWRSTSDDARRFAARLGHLPWRAKLKLAAAIATDHRVPIAARAIPPALVLYLAMPFDIVPDFIPVLGQLDDIAVLVVGAGLLLRLTPRAVLEEHLARLETPASTRD